MAKIRLCYSCILGTRNLRGKKDIGKHLAESLYYIDEKNPKSLSSMSLEYQFCTFPRKAATNSVYFP